MSMLPDSCTDEATKQRGLRDLQRSIDTILGYAAACAGGRDKRVIIRPKKPEDPFQETPEEREAFERIYREQQIAAMVEIAGQCSTTSLTGICTKLFEAGCRIEEVKHG